MVPATPNSELIARYNELDKANANEAETRLKIINEILFRVLGWTHDDLTVEERVSEDGSTTYADYVLKTGATSIVIEAKRAHQTLEEIPNARTSPLKGKILSGETGEAVVQARDYARKLGIPFAAITNGDKWLIFPATRVDQVSFANSMGVVFSSIEVALQDDFSAFYDLMSRESVIGGSLENELLGRLENQLEERRLNRIFTTSISKVSRQSLFPLIEEAVVSAFTEDVILHDYSLLEKCYVRTPERVKFDDRIRMHVIKRQNITQKSPLRPLRDQSGQAILGIIDRASKASRPVALIVLGTVGTGKTTFLEYTKNIAAKDLFQVRSDVPYPHWIRVDFKKFTPSADSLSFMMKEILFHINYDPFMSDYERCIKHAYKDEIESLTRGPLFLLSASPADKNKQIVDIIMTEYRKEAPYAEKILRYVSKNSPVFLVIDNMDQIEDEKKQRDIFSDAMALAQNVGLNLVCSMREATYAIHRGSAIFDAFDFDPIYIDPPAVEAVLSRRFFVASQILHGKSGSFVAENGARFEIENLSIIVEMLKESVLGTELGRLIDVMATSDIRLALRMTRTFLQTGYTSSSRALNIYKTTGKYIMPQHEALRAIMLGNRQVYLEEHSVIANPFDARMSRTEAQLLRLYLLAGLVQFSSESTFRSLEGGQIRDIFRDLGFSDEVTIKVMIDLCDSRFIHTLSHSPASFEAAYVPSRLGGYVVRNLIANFTFIENTMMDTFIADTNVWNELRGLSNQIFGERRPIERLRLRKSRVKVFFSHMKECYKILHDQSMKRRHSKEWCTNPFHEIERQFDSNLERAISSAERNYGLPERRH